MPLVRHQALRRHGFGQQLYSAEHAPSAQHQHWITPHLQPSQTAYQRIEKFVVVPAHPSGSRSVSTCGAVRLVLAGPLLPIGLVLAGGRNARLP
jgi:hypothetical protein